MDPDSDANRARTAEIETRLAALQLKMDAARLAQGQQGNIDPRVQAALANLAESIHRMEEAKANGQMAQMEETARFLKAQLDQAKANLEQARALDPNADSNQARGAEIEARKAELAALKAKFSALEQQATLTQTQPPMTLDTIPTRPERLVLPPSMARQFEGRTLRSIRLAGVSLSTEDFLARAQVPIRPGDTLTQNSIEATVDAVKKFDNHLGERWTAVGPDGMDLIIYAQGGPRGGIRSDESGSQASAPEGVSPPQIIIKTAPEYTDEARRARWQGSVALSVTVDETGKATDIRVTQPLGMGLDQKAVEAVGKWKFKPGMKDGKPVSATATFRVDFRLP
jgi:TonB family protein